MTERPHAHLRVTQKLATKLDHTNRRVASRQTPYFLTNRQQALVEIGVMRAQQEGVAECFDDWQRSNLLFKLPLLHRHKLLREEHILNLTTETRERLGRFIGTENVWSQEE